MNNQSSMPIRPFRSRPELSLATLALALFATACGDSTSDTAPQPTQELRGQPIARHPPIAPAPLEAESELVAPVVTKLEAPSTTLPEPNDPIASDDNASIDPTPPTETTPVPVALESSDEESSTSSEETDEDFKVVGFEKLSAFEFEMSDDILNPPTESDTNISARTEAMIPDGVRAFDNQRVALKGFMLPLKVEGGLVTELLVMKDQSMCCFGTVPKINEWVSVKMVEKGIKPIMDQPVTLFGKLNVGEMRENGYLVGIYSMDGERMAGPLDN